MVAPMSLDQILGAVVAIVILAVLIALARKVFGAEAALPYFSRQWLLTKGESVFYQTLRQATPDHLIICMKVRMGDVVNCSGQAWKAGFGARISQKHLDFVLVDAQTTAIAMAIELDDRSHRRADRIERDEFVDRVFAAAGVPLLRVPAAAKYDVKLRQEIASRVEDTAAVGMPQ